VAKSPTPSKRTTKRTTARKAPEPAAESGESSAAAAAAEPAVIEIEERAPQAAEPGTASEAPETAEPAAAPETPRPEATVAEPPVPPVPPVPPAPPGARRDRGMGGLIAAGLAAGAIGFLAAGFAASQGWFGVRTADTGTLTADLAAAEAKISDLAGKVVALQTAPPAAAPAAVDLGPIEARLKAAEDAGTAGFARLGKDLDALGARVAALEARPLAGAGGDAAAKAQLDAFRAELKNLTDAARAEVVAAETRAKEIEAKAAAAEQQAAVAKAAADRQAALAELASALDSGTPFAAVLPALGTVPPALTDSAETGVPTLASLQIGYPAAARAALHAVQVVPETASVGSRLTAFLRRQTNARSLTPQEGDGPDAVLSRAEAALGEGKLGTALDELAKLPDPARNAMAGWLAKADARNAAVAAAKSLSAG